MDEKNKEQENKEGEENNKPGPEDSGAGSEQKTTPLIERANEAAARMETANKQMMENLNRQEEMIARQALGGQAEAGGQAQKKQPETEEEYTKRVMSGELNVKA